MKILHWIKSFGRVFVFLPVFLFLGVNVGAADLSYDIIAEGDGETAQNGMQVSVHYQGRLTDGTIFDDSQKRGVPFSFILGSGPVIPGWEQGIAGIGADQGSRTGCGAFLRYVGSLVVRYFKAPGCAASGAGGGRLPGQKCGQFNPYRWNFKFLRR